MQITVTVEKILCAKTESKWYFFRAMMGNSVIVCKGSMGWTPMEMETLALCGDYVEYKGERQFQFKGAKLTLPLDSRSQLDYVCERSSGIGSVICQQIWQARGEDWRELERGEIRKMTEPAYDSFREQIGAFAVNQEKAEVIAWLENKGCSTAMAEDAFEEWGKDASGVVHADCYRLAVLSRYSFKVVDENIRRNFDIADDDPRRIKSAVQYAFDQETSDGSTALECWRHFASVQKLLVNIGDEVIKNAVHEMMVDGSAKIFPSQAMMVLKRDYTHELMIYHFVQKSLSATPVNVDGLDDWHDLGFVPDKTQIDAVKHAVTTPFAIVNGGAGVGKTTVIKMIVEGIKKYYPHLGVNLCAPTGKAAARLKEASGIKASTIHLLLGSRGDRIFKGGPLDQMAVIVDESSMVDSSLLFEIMIRKPAKLVLVGDQAQLTPVGAGQPFHDLIEIFPRAVRTLSKCYRNSEAVFQAATQIRNGNVPMRYAKSDNELWVFSPAGNPADVQKRICDWAREGVLDFSCDIVLCPKNGKRQEDDRFQDSTVNALNEDLLYIDRERRGMIGSEKFAVGDRVINTVNNPEAKVWNGTTGTIHAVNDENQLFVKLDVPIKNEYGETDTVLFDKDMIKNLRHAYALTVHKSQGSQYRKVVMAVLSRDIFQLDRSLVYTGVTRTQQECVIVGDYNAFAKSIQTVRKKNTCMQCLMIDDLEMLDAMAI